MESTLLPRCHKKIWTKGNREKEQAQEESPTIKIKRTMMKTEVEGFLNPSLKIGNNGLAEENHNHKFLLEIMKSFTFIEIQSQRQ